MSYTPVIGLEVHLQLATRTKIFCSCSTVFGAPPNSQVCPICLGLPGVLPVLNRQVLASGIRVALGLQCRICPRLLFHRKHYFYPDLPKGFQISQYDLPLGSGGWVAVGQRKIRIRRVHMEEDAGKLVHTEGAQAVSLVDFNRCGMPLLEIVTEPDLTSPEEAHAYLKTLKGILQYLEVSDCDMEKGSLRCDANISLQVPSPHRGEGQGEGELGTKVEIKNLNSFKAVARALAYEIQRQSQRLSQGERIPQETCLWDDARGVTLPMRSKEYAHDYRYFPEPDLVPFHISAEMVQQVRASLPELPGQRAERLLRTYRLSESDARALTASKETADYFEAAVGGVQGDDAGEKVQALAHWILGEMNRQLNERGLESVADLRFPPEHLVDLMELIHSGKISGKMAKQVFVDSLRTHTCPSEVVRAQGLAQVTDRAALQAAARGVLEEQAGAVSDYRQGKRQALMFLVGQLMRKTGGAASPEVSQAVLRELLEKQE